MSDEKSPDSAEAPPPAPAVRPKRKAAKRQREYLTPVEFANQVMRAGIQRSGPGFFSTGTQHSYRVNLKKGYLLHMEMVDELYDALDERDA